MKFSKNGFALASAFCVFMGACADVDSDEPNTPAEGSGASADALAQVAPIDWPGTTPRDAGASRPTPTQPAPKQPSTGSGTGTRITVPDPNGVYFADISASGTGCPAGSWNARLSDDSLAFTITFSKYQVSVSNTDTTDRKSMNCALVLKMNSPKGLSYAVSYISYSGMANLEPGVRAVHNTNYDFTGQNIQASGATPRGAKTRTFNGPYNDSFVFEDKVSTQDVVFSQCGTTRDLLVQTSLQVVNGRPKKSGVINVAAIDGRTSGAIVVKLSTRRC